MPSLPTHALFLDFETEGLDPAVHLPLEIAGFLVELASLEQVGDPVEVLIPLPGDAPLSQVRYWDEPVRDMHQASGLLNAVVTGQADHPNAVVGTAYHADIMLVSLLREHGVATPIPLAGYGVSHMEDRGWVTTHLPRLGAELTYWQLDVSGLRRTLQAFGFACEKGGNDHRALFDIDAAASELRTYRSIFRKSDYLVHELGMAVPSG